MAKKQILIICGEPSGELHAVGLVSAIKKINPDIQISGIGSSLLAQAGAEIFYDIKGLSVMGLFDVLKKLPRFINLKKLILKKIASERFDAVILVDFSGFNLRLAKAINKRIPTIYYVSPQVWASRAGRIKNIKKYIQKMIVLFEFEKGFYKKHGINADCVGHPLLDIVKPCIDKEELRAKLNFSPEKTTIALLPGSRKQEISKILPVMLKVAALINKKINAQFLIAKAPQADWKIYDRIINRSHCEEGEARRSNHKNEIASLPSVARNDTSCNFLKILDGKTYDALNIADFALVCSGTATLETAIMQKPFLIIYKMGLLNYLLYRPQIKIPYIGIVNIIAGKKIIPEFIQFGASPKKIAQKTLEILNNRVKLENMRADLAAVKSSLGQSGASARAAKIIIDFIK
ncbi:MAG: hypothetical protein Q7K98_02910 [Candidatus Omnitrophota bacterium]|nr:hypothetical protein [Candidatus Omnitrophota bacterium]